MYPNETELQWSVLIVLYPFITGLVAGAFILASLERVFRVQAVKPTYRLALLTALAFLLVAPMPLQLHLAPRRPLLPRRHPPRPPHREYRAGRAHQAHPAVAQSLFRLRRIRQRLRRSRGAAADRGRARVAHRTQIGRAHV